MVLKPSIKVLDQNGADVPYEIAGPVKLAILGYQHNKPFNIAVNKWRGLLFPKDRPSIFEFPGGYGIEFQIPESGVPRCLRRFGLPRGGRSAPISEKLRSLLKYRGLELPEPTLVFCDRRNAAHAPTRTRFAALWLILLCQTKILASDHVGKYNVMC